MATENFLDKATKARHALLSPRRDPSFFSPPLCPPQFSRHPPSPPNRAKRTPNRLPLPPLLLPSCSPRRPRLLPGALPRRAHRRPRARRRGRTHPPPRLGLLRPRQPPVPLPGRPWARGRRKGCGQGRRRRVDAASQRGVVGARGGGGAAPGGGEGRRQRGYVRRADLPPLWCGSLQLIGGRAKMPACPSALGWERFK